MGRELLVRKIKAAALARMEDAARTESDFKVVIKLFFRILFTLLECQ